MGNGLGNYTSLKKFFMKMEAVPRLSMLCFDLRTSAEKVDFSGKLKQYIRSHYNEDPTLYGSGITGIESMRREAVCPSKSISGCSLLKRYYCQLHFMASRFPMRENEEAAVPFSWKSPYSSTAINLNDISLEMASILYNIGALHSLLGAMDNRTTSEGMKMSCTHFQCAAWAFQHITEEFPYVKSLGFSQVLLSFKCHLCLAQAQECILEKSMMDNRKSAITAKVAVQVVDYYTQSLKLLMDWPQDESNPSEINNSKVFKKWQKYVQFKIAYYESISLLFQGQQSEDQQKMGERVAFYQAAFEKLEEARKLAVDNMQNIGEALSFVFDVIEVKRKAAKNENEFIYHEDVPNISYLPKIKGASLVKGIPFSINDPEVCGPDLFSSIIPMKAHEYSSLYSEEKAKLLRKINEVIENKDEELETFLSMLDLDEVRLKLEGSKLPQELVDKCAALNAKPDAIQNLKDAMAKLSDVYHDVEAMLNEIRELLKEEENHEKEYQQMVGKRPPSIAATDLTREAKKYQEAHAKASESNQTLHKAMVMHISNLELLSLPLKELINHIPTISESPEVEAVTNEMRHLISKVEEMKQQRLMLAGQLRDMVCQDDITSKVITHSGDKMDELFEQELKKYDRLVSLIEQNLAAQENILKAMQDTYTRFGSTRKSTGALHRRRTGMISSLIASYDAYEDLVSKSSKGLDFYKKLETNVSKLLQRVKGTCKVQDEEREQLLKNVKKPDFGYPQSEAPPSNTLKLKDYLNIKKETGKLSIDSHPAANIPPASSYYNDSKLPQPNWIPGIRPAPVGSEETDTNLKATSDTFRGFYQGQGKDQVWSNNFYSVPQNSDQKLKYYLPQNVPVYQNYSQNPPQTQGPDLYPISSYSTVMPKTDGQSYEPKSNYYDIQSSPNRIFNPVQSFKEPLTSCSGATIPTYVPPEAGYNQPLPSGMYSQNPPAASQYPFATQMTENYTAPQNTTSQTYLPPQETSVGAYSFTPQNQAVNQNPVSSVYNAVTYNQPPQSYGTDSNQIPYGSDASGYCTYPAPTSADYNPYSASQPTVQSSTADPAYASNTSSYSMNYQVPASQAPMPAAGFAGTQEQVQPYQNIQNYQIPMSNPASDGQISNYVTPGQPLLTDGATSSSYYSKTPEAAPVPSSYYTSKIPDPGPVQPQQNTGVAPQSWQASYNPTPPNQQYFQSGNESLYTASQTPNSYTMINSDVYKAGESQGVNYPANPNYGSQYYTNQYGGYGGQTDINSQNGNPVTYMQAGTDKQQAVTTTTYSYSEAKSSSVTNPSNVDLLAGLDFNINHEPLEPQTTVPVKREETSSGTPVSSKTEVKILPEASQKTTNFNAESNEEKIPPKDWMTNMESFNHFAQEVEKYEKFVEGLTLKTLNGPTSLDLKWKEIVDHQEKVSAQHIISVARCYPMKNRFPDILPYDDSRIELPSTKDDYINASKMTNLTKLTPPFVLTQAPLPSTYSDFWAMVFEQQVEIIICLLKDSELEGHLYWPTEKSQELDMGKLKISLQSSNVRSHWVERILSICLIESRMTRVVVHLQFTAWPGSSFPESPGPFLSFASECLNYFSQQRSYSHPVVVHCSSGVGRTGLFCLLIASLLDIQAGKGIPDLAALAGRMCEFRKSCLRDREHLKFAYQAVLYYCQDFLMKRGILSNRSSFEDKKSKSGKCHTRHPSEDFLVPPGAESDKLQAGIERLEIDSREKKQETENKNASGGARSQSVCSSVSHTSSGRSSPSSLPADIMSTLDSVNFSLKADQSQKKKRFTPESFNKNSTLEAPSTSSDDPLSQLDPLWTMKK